MATATGGRRPPATADDKFVASVLSILDWAQRNTRPLILAFIALALLVGGVVYYLDYRRRVREVASTEIRAIRFGLEMGSPSEVVERLRSFIAQFGGTPYETEAKLLLANALLLENRAADAVEPARQASRDLGDDPLATRAAFLLAAAYEEVPDTASAIGVYEEIGRKAGARPDRVRGYEGAARLRAARGDVAEAALLYDRLIELIPEESPRRGFYEMRAGEMRASSARFKATTGTEGAQGLRP